MRIRPSADFRPRGRGYCCCMSGVRILTRFCHRSANCSSSSEEIRGPLRSCRQGANTDVFGDRPKREYAVTLTVSGDQRDGIGHLEPGKAAGRTAKDGQQQLRLSMTRETGQPDNFALMRHAVQCRRRESESAHEHASGSSRAVQTVPAPIAFYWTPLRPSRSPACLDQRQKLYQPKPLRHPA